MPQSGSVIHQSYDAIDGLGKQVAPNVPGTGVAFANPFTFACMVRVKGGTVTGIAVAGVTYFAASPGIVYIDVGESITLTYSVAPTWDWFGVPGK